MRVAGGGGDAGIDRLAALRDQHEVIDYPLPQRAKNAFPRLRQGTIGCAKRCRYARPRALGAGVKARARFHHHLESFLSSLTERSSAIVRIPAIGRDFGVP